MAFFNGLKNNHTLAQLVMELNPIGVAGAIEGWRLHEIANLVQFTSKDHACGPVGLGCR